MRRLSRLDWLHHYLNKANFQKGIWIREFSDLWGECRGCAAFWYVTADNLRLFSLPTTCKIIVLSLLLELFESYIETLIADMAICKTFSTCSS